MAVEFLQPYVYNPPVTKLKLRGGRKTLKASWLWGYTSKTQHFEVYWQYTDFGGILQNGETIQIDANVRESVWTAPPEATSAIVTVLPVSLRYGEDTYIYDNNDNPVFGHRAGDLYFTTTAGVASYTFEDIAEFLTIQEIPALDYAKTMVRTYEYYKVDPVTWLNTERLDNITTSKIVYDAGADTLGSATFDISSDVGECYIRTYMVMIQDKREHKECLGTHLCQTKGGSFDGKRQSVSIDAYTALAELKEQPPPIGYSVLIGSNVLGLVSNLVRETIRPPIIPSTGTAELTTNFVSTLDDTWFTFLRDLLSTVNYGFGLDDLGRIILVPKQDFNSLQPVWTYNDNNSSILQPDVKVSHDLYGIPNVLEVIYSDENQGTSVSVKVINDDPNSPVSTVNRGRQIVNRITDPEVYGVPDEEQLTAYARRQLRYLSSLEYTVTYTHAYCPVRVNDCVLLNYERADLKNVKAKVIRQSIKCDTSGQVEETAIYSTNLWG